MTAKELSVYRAQYDIYDRIVAASSEAEARKLLGSPDVHRYADQILAIRVKRRPGVVFRKPHGVKAKCEAW